MKKQRKGKKVVTEMSPIHLYKDLDMESEEETGFL
jgi:hypothetical protein